MISQSVSVIRVLMCSGDAFPQSPGIEMHWSEQRTRLAGPTQFRAKMLRFVGLCERASLPCVQGLSSLSGGFGTGEVYSMNLGRDEERNSVFVAD
jgi:hypothetical protein